jgi:hypothetical protein
LSPINDWINIPPGTVQYDAHLEDVFRRLQNSTFYLGNPSLSDHVQWIDAGKRRVLVEKTDDVSNDGYDGAALECIGIINPVNFWLYPCAGWAGNKGPLNNWDRNSPFEKARARARLCSHHHPNLLGAWEKGLDNLKSIIQSSVANSPSQVQLDTTKLFEGNQIRFRHAIFQVSFFPLLIYKY